MGCTMSNLTAKFAFFPPSPATYEVTKRDSDGKFLAMRIAHGDDPELNVHVIETKRGNKIVAFYLRNPYARLTVLYSHGNAADLGQLYDLFLQLKINLRVNLMGYDYSGYGASTGKPSEANTYADIEAVYQCLQTEYGVSQEDLILYGQSVGSGPTLHLAAKLPRLRGVVLHSAILSGLRVLCHVKFSCCFDVYRNIKKIQKVKCPVLVIHGTEDDVVNWLHGNGLWKRAREPYEPLWIKGGGHCNLELYPDYMRHLCKFIHEMESMTTETLLKKIRQTLNLPPKSSSDPKAVTSYNRSCGWLDCFSCSCKMECQCPRCPDCFSCSSLTCLGCFQLPKCSGCCSTSCLKCLKPRCSGCGWCFSSSSCCSTGCLKCLKPGCLGCGWCFSSSSCCSGCCSTSCLKCLKPGCLGCGWCFSSSSCCPSCCSTSCLKCLKPGCLGCGWCFSSSCCCCCCSADKGRYD